MNPKVAIAIEQEDLRSYLVTQVYAYKKEKLPLSEVLEKLVSLNDNQTNPLPEEEIGEIVKEHYKITPKKGKKDEDENVKYTSFYEDNNYILEQCRVAGDADDAGGPEIWGFAVFNKSSSVVTYEKEKIISDCIIRPIEDDFTANKCVKLPSKAEEYGTTAELIEEIKVFLYKYFEVPSFEEKFIPYLILFYWVYDRFPFIPYLHFVGLTGTGKTTAQEVIGSICYKSIDASGSLSMSPIFRTASKWRGTLLLDEFEPEGDSYKEMLQFLKGTVSDKVILRTEGEANREVKAYMAKCPKIFTSEQPINNAGLQSRTFVVRMEKNKKQVPLYRLRKFETEAQKIRNKLLLWRFHHLSKVDLDEIEYGYPELAGFDGRVQQVITPIYYFSDEATRKSIALFAIVQQEETQRERREALEGQIMGEILAQWPNEPSLVSITAKINGERSQKPLSEKRIASLIRKVLRFDIEVRGHDKLSYIVLVGKEETVKEHCKYFGFSFPEEPPASPANGQIALQKGLNLAGDSSGTNTASPAQPANDIEQSYIDEFENGHTST